MGKDVSLDVHVADLLKDNGWDEAIKGCDKNKIQIYSETYNLIKEDFEIIEQRKVNIKGLGATKTYIFR